MPSVLRLGRDHPVHGTHHLDAVGDRAAAAISAGATSRIPKADPNEDALYVRDEGGRVWFGVADAHWGEAGSALLLETLAGGLENLRRAEPALGAVGRDDWLRLLLVLQEEWETLVPEVGGSETTLVLAAYDRTQAAGRVYSYGDSSLVWLPPDGAATRLNTKTPNFVAPEQPDTMALDRLRRRTFEAAPGGLLLAFTDGVDECHYGSPDTSIQLAHLEALFRETGPDARAFAERLTRLALTGVDGNPGGEDNIALVVVAT